MYNGLHPNANQLQLQQTYDQLQNRAFEELNSEIKRLKDIIVDKDGEINKLKEITNQGTLQKKLANILEENNNFKLQIKQYTNNEKEIKEIKQELSDKNNEIYRLNEKIHIINEEFKQLTNRNTELNQEIIAQKKVISNNELQKTQITDLKKEITKYKTLITELKNATKITFLETEISELNNKIKKIKTENVIISENNKEVTHAYSEIKAKYTNLLNNFETKMESNHLKFKSKITNLTNDSMDATHKLQTEISKNKALKTQIKESQSELSEMETLNLKLIKGYNLENAINDLQNTKNQKLNLQNELKEMTKKLSKKEKTNLILLNKNKLLKTQTIHASNSDDLSEESYYFDHYEQIESFKENIQRLKGKIDKLESDKYKLLIQLHESQDCESNGDNKLCINGLDTQQQSKVKLFVQKLIKQSLMPNGIDCDTTVDMQELREENTKLKEWKDTLMTKLFETGTVNGTHTMKNEDTEMDMKTESKDITNNTDLIETLGINYEEINDKRQDYSTEIKEIIAKHTKYVSIVLNVIGSNNGAIGSDINILMSESTDLITLQKENEALKDKIEDLKGYKLRHSKIESILREKSESELIKKVENVSKENMIFVVNQKKLSAKYANICKEQRYLFGEYQNLLKYLMEIEHYLCNKLLFIQSKNDNLTIFINSVLHKISNSMIPLDSYKNMEIECKSLNQTKQYLLAIIDKYQSQSIQYFKCKSANVSLQNKLIEIEFENNLTNPNKEEIIYNAETATNSDNETETVPPNEKYKCSIRLTEKEMEIRGKKYENAMSEMAEMNEYSAMLHQQINELRSICLDQSTKITDLEKKLGNDSCDKSEFNALESKYDKLNIEYHKKLNEIDSLKQKTEFSVSSLQALQSKIISSFNIDNSDDSDGNANIENILKQTQKINNKLGMNAQSIKSLKDKVCGLEIEILKKEQSFNDLQMRYFNIQKSKRFLEANFNCIYSKTLHKTSNKYLKEIDSLRNKNEELYEYLHCEQSKTKNIYADMIDYKVIIESLKLKCDDLQTLLKQFAIESESQKYLKNWQSKCTNLEIKQIEFVNQTESLQNEIQFLRTENGKYLVNIGSLQKKVSVLTQELQNTKHEIIKKYELNPIQQTLLQKEPILTKHKCIQTHAIIIQNGKEESINNDQNEQNLHELQGKIVTLQEIITNLQNESVCTEKRVLSATKGLQIMLGTAQDTILNLQSLLKAKNESIDEYKNMITKLLKKIKENQRKYASHLNAVKLKYKTESNTNDEMILAQLQNMNDNNANVNEWSEMSAIKTSLKEKQNVISGLRERNEGLSADNEEMSGNIEGLETRMNEYHCVIQELNEKILALQQSLHGLKDKLKCKKRENIRLTKTVKCLKENIFTKTETVPPKHERNKGKSECAENDEMDHKMRKMENEYKMLRSSLKSEIDDGKERINEYFIERKSLKQKCSDLRRECQGFEEKLSQKSKLIHRLQVQISKIQKDKITMQEKHSLSLKLHRKKQNGLESQISKLREFENKNKSLTECEHKLRKQIGAKDKELSKIKSKISGLMSENKSLVKQNLKSEKFESDTVVALSENERNALKTEIFELKKVIELEQVREIKKLKNENDLLQRKNALPSKDVWNENKELRKLFEEIEAKQNKIIDLETDINELKFDREYLEINLSKNERQNNANKQNIDIRSRNDPELQNVLDSMKFIINKLKKENESLKKWKCDNNQSNASSIRISNLLKENRSLKRKVSERSENDSAVLKKEIEQKNLEIERISNLNKTVRKESNALRDMNNKYVRASEFKKSEIKKLKQMIENEKQNLRLQINEMEMIWKRKMSLTNDDLLRYKKMKKEFEKELSHKNGINQKMSNEIKALIELIDHTKNITNQQKENDRLSLAKLNERIETLERENAELRSELSAFDVSFFNEIEDLKYREAEAQQLIIELQQSSQQTNHNNQNHDFDILHNE